MASLVEADQQFEDSDDEDGLTGDDEYLLSDKFDPGVWLEKAAAKFGKARRRWFVLHRRERQLAYYTLAFIPPAKAKRKGSIKLDDITGISNKDNSIEISVAKGRSMYRLLAEDDKTAADWSYILKVETRQIQPMASHQNIFNEYSMVNPDVATDSSLLAKDGAYLTMQPDITVATDGAYLAMQPDLAQDGSYLSMQPDSFAQITQDGSYLAMAADDEEDTAVMDGQYLAMSPDSLDNDQQHQQQQHQQQSSNSYHSVDANFISFVVNLTRGPHGFGLMFGGGEDEKQAQEFAVGVFISGIKTTSPAVPLASVKVGLQVLSINGQDLSNGNLSNLSPVIGNVRDHMTMELRENPVLFSAYTHIDINTTTSSSPNSIKNGATNGAANTTPSGYEAISMDLSDGYANVEPATQFTTTDQHTTILKPEPEYSKTEGKEAVTSSQTNPGSYGVIEPFKDQAKYMNEPTEFQPEPTFSDLVIDDENTPTTTTPSTTTTATPPPTTTSSTTTTTTTTVTTTPPQVEVDKKEDECSYGVIEPFCIHDGDVVGDDYDDENTQSYGVVDMFDVPSETVAVKDFSQTHVVSEGNESLYLGLDPDAAAQTPERRTDPDSYHVINPEDEAPVEPPVPEFAGTGFANFVALFAYVAANFDELDALPGHKFCIVEVWPDGWAFGKNLDTDKIGILPGNFLGIVLAIEGEAEITPPEILTSFPDRYATVEPDVLQRKTDPSSYQQVTPEGEDVTPPLPEFTGDNNTNYKCSSPFQAQNFDELSASVGDTFCITEIWPDGWYFGKNLTTNQIGIIPGNFVVFMQAVDGVALQSTSQPTRLAEFPDRYTLVKPDVVDGM